ERLASAGAGAALILTAGIVVAARQTPFVLISGAALALAGSVAFARRRRGTRLRATRAPAAEGAQGRVRQALASTRAVGVDLWRNRRSALAAIGALALAQEAVNVSEAYLLLNWLGAAPPLATVIVFEGANRAANIAGQFVPGRIGVSEASSTLAAGTLRLTPTYGLSLALTRRARSLLWAVVGLSVLVVRNVRANAAGSERREPRGAIAPA
ncbi:MAG: flippase-like domain-containing protein, partial [Acidobacteria bacterium]|nr:flippase-like domain-containing protein [Acidobacteriota bacterium]